MNKIEADKKLEKKYNNIIERRLHIIPNIKAWFFVILPVGIGLRQVLFISASKSASYHWLRAPAAPAPIATAIKENAEFKKLICAGAINIPTTQVKITKDITLGFISWNKFPKKFMDVLIFILLLYKLGS